MRSRKVRVNGPRNDDVEECHECTAGVAGPQRAGRTAAPRDRHLGSRSSIDGTGRTELASGIAFLDHMLDQVGAPRRCSISSVDAKGDLHIDAHHTVEDIGITLGQAFKQALGDKKGIRRYGHAYVPLDEALSRVVLDLSGRPGLEFHVPFTRALVGDVRRRPRSTNSSRASSITRW